MEISFSPKLLAVAVAAAIPLLASAADTPSTATAREGYAGYDHPNQYLVKPATTIADNMMPVMQHPAQDKETQQKLAELEKKTGKKPNVVIFLLDDVGWMDVGFNGGGVAVGKPGADFNLRVFSTQFFTNPRDDSHRTVFYPPRHFDAADVRTTRWSARVNYPAAIIA